MFRPWRRWALALLLGSTAALAYWQYELAGQATSVYEPVLVPVYLTVGFGLLAGWLLPRATAGLRHVHQRAPLAWATIAAAGALGLAAAGLLRPPLADSQAAMRITTPTQGPAEPRQHHLEVIATGQQAAASKAAEVWLEGLDFADGRQALVTDFQLGTGWQMRDGVAMSTGQPPGSLTWDGPTTGDAQLRLLTHGWSGWAEVDWDGTRQRLNLYRPTATEIVVPLPYTGALAAPPATFMQTAALAAAVVSLAALLYSAGGLAVVFAHRQLRSKVGWEASGGPRTPAA